MVQVLLYYEVKIGLKKLFLQYRLLNFLNEGRNTIIVLCFFQNTYKEKTGQIRIAISQLKIIIKSRSFVKGLNFLYII